jgi:uncharacterized cupredoxin-like copper-binding protein
MTPDADASPDLARGTLLALATALALTLLAGPVLTPASAHGAAYDLTVEASEDCPDTTYCFEVTEGSVDEVAPGEEVNLTIVNPEDNSRDHNLYVTTIGQASEDRDTDASAAEKNTDTVSPGEQASLEYFVPQGADGLYVWCDVGVHENQGMYLEIPFTEDASNPGEEETNNSPGLGVATLIGTLAVIALLSRQRDA